MVISCIVSDIKRDSGRKLRFFIPLALCLKKLYPLMFDNNFGNVDWFSKLFRQLSRRKILYVHVYTTNISTSPAVCFYITLWSSKIEVTHNNPWGKTVAFVSSLALDALCDYALYKSIFTFAFHNEACRSIHWPSRLMAFVLSLTNPSGHSP